MLKEKIQEDLKDSLKSGDKLKRLVLGMVTSAMKNRELLKRGQLSKTIADPVELEKQSQLTDEEIMEVLSSEVKKRKESVEQFKAGGRQELVEKESSEIEILVTYLPEQVDEHQIRNEIQIVIMESGATGPKDMGKVISAVMAKLKGRADGALVSKIVKEALTP